MLTIFFPSNTQVETILTWMQNHNFHRNIYPRYPRWSIKDHCYIIEIPQR